jgi:hypothetical protein
MYRAVALAAGSEPPGELRISFDEQDRVWLDGRDVKPRPRYPRAEIPAGLDRLLRLSVRWRTSVGARIEGRTARMSVSPKGRASA